MALTILEGIKNMSPRVCPSSLRTDMSYTRDYIFIANFLGMALIPFALLAIINFKLFRTIKVKLSTFFLLRTIISKGIFSFVYRQNYLPPKKKRLRLMFKIPFICQQPIVRLLAQPAIKIELYPVYQSQDNV